MGGADCGIHCMYVGGADWDTLHVYMWEELTVGHIVWEELHDCGTHCIVWEELTLGDTLHGTGGVDPITCVNISKQF